MEGLGSHQTAAQGQRKNFQEKLMTFKKKHRGMMRQNCRTTLWQNLSN